MRGSPGFEPPDARRALGSAEPAGAPYRDPFPRATLRDLVRRTWRASGDLGEDRAALGWARSILTSSELALWSAQSAYDRAHSIRVARRVEHRLARTGWAGDPRWLAAALMHDVGKLRAGLSLFERIVANVVRRAVGLDRARGWANHASGVRLRIGAYFAHAEVGAEMIRRAGGREEVAAWAEVHQTHSGGPVSGIPAAVAAALLASDVG